MVLVFMTLITRAIDAQDVSWLAEVQRPPNKPATFDLGTMQPLMKLDDGRPVENLESWTRRRHELNSAWQSFLGPSPQFPSNTTTTVLKTESVGNITRSLIRYECEPDLFVEAFLLRPTSSDTTVRRPGLVALHHTATATIDEIAGVSGPESRKIGLKLAQRGFIVICPRCFLWQDASSLPNAVEAFHKRNPQSLGMRKMLFDAQRALDILAAQPDVDPKRIGAVGHSLGAKEALYLAAFDDRIRAAVASEGGTALGSTNWDAPWYLGQQIHDPEFVRNHHELLAMIAPRAFLILGGETGPGAADGDRSWPLIEAALPVYELYRTPPRLGLLNHHQGHSIPDDVFERMSEWLETYLRSSE
jgi:dienelactone hydrolase